MGLPYQQQYCTFDSFPQMVSVNSSGTQISDGDKRQDVRDGIRKSTCFKTSDYSSGAKPCANFSAFTAIGQGDCCHPVVKTALEKLGRIVEIGGTGSDIPDANLNELMNRCVNTWSVYGNNFSNSERRRVGRYCRQKAAEYYNELRGKYNTCKANFNPANFGEVNTHEICGCMDDAAVNYDPAATNSNGICGVCEYADDRPENAWGTDNQGNAVVYVGSGSGGSDDKPPLYGTSPANGGGSNIQGPICWSPCPNPVSVQSINPYCPASHPLYTKPTCDKPSSNLSLDAITDRIGELADMLANRPAPTTATSNAEIDALRSEMSMLQNLYMQGQQPPMGYDEAPQKAGMGNIPVWAILGAVAVIGLVVVLNKRKGASAPVAMPTPTA